MRVLSGVLVVLISVRIVVACFQRDWIRIAELVGARGLDEEVEEERRHAQEELQREHDLIARRKGH